MGGNPATWDDPDVVRAQIALVGEGFCAAPWCEPTRLVVTGEWGQCPACTAKWRTDGERLDLCMEPRSQGSAA